MAVTKLDNYDLKHHGNYLGVISYVAEICAYKPSFSPTKTLLRTLLTFSIQENQMKIGQIKKNG